MSGSRKWLRKVSANIPPRLMCWIYNIYPPYLGAGIKVKKISKDRRYLKVILKLNFFNRNYVGTQFGGSIYSMTDPHYMFLIMSNLGPDYIVWDKAATVNFIAPGKTDIFAEFVIDEVLLLRIKEKTRNGDKYIFDLPVTVNDINNQLVAKVIKTLYVRKKQISSI